MFLVAYQLRIGNPYAGIHLRFDNVLTVVTVLYRVRLSRWVLARSCSFLARVVSPLYFVMRRFPIWIFIGHRKPFVRTIISKLQIVYWRNAGAGNVRVVDVGTKCSALAGSDADLPKAVGESALRQALFSLES